MMKEYKNKKNNVIFLGNNGYIFNSLKIYPKIKITYSLIIKI